jgi:hypothetical protein
MKHHVENLEDLYVENYLQPISQQTNSLVSESTDRDLAVLEAKKKAEGEEDAKDVKKFKKSRKAFRKGKREKYNGSMYYDSVNYKTVDSLFNKLVREFDEGGFADDAFAGNDNDGEYSFDEEEADEMISVSKNTLQSIIDQLQSLLGEEEEDMFDDEGYEGEEDSEDIPLESVDREASGNYHGDQGNYSGKANRQPKSRFVKDNGDADFGQQDTGYDPEDTEGSEGQYLGDQGNYNGKANKQPKSNHVQDNGNAKTGTSQRTGYGKKEREDLF